jgi:hypothetical protein
MEGNFGPMDPKTPQRDDKTGIQHPYKRYEGSPQWQILNEALDALVKNGDVQETTNRVYVVGYLCQALASIEQVSPGRNESRKECV